MNADVTLHRQTTVSHPTSHFIGKLIIALTLVVLTTFTLLTLEVHLANPGDDPASTFDQFAYMP